MKLFSRLTNAISAPLRAARAKKQATLASDISSSLGRILRPQAAYRWLLPQLAAITPEYIEMTLRGALAGNHVQAWELFDLMEDTWPRLRKNGMELKNGVRNLGRVYTEYSEEEQEPTPSATEKMRLVSAALRTMRPDPAADESALSGILFDIMDAWLKGQSVIEIDWERRDAGKLGTIIAPRAGFWVHPVCYAWSMEGRLGLRADNRGVLSPGNISTTSYQPMPSAVAEFPPEKFLISICKTKSGSALGGALLRPLAWWWCAANFSADWLLNLAQVFGLPFRWATYDPNVPQATIDAICAMLAGMGSAGWAAFPTGTQLDLKEASKGGDHSPQGDLLDRADKQCDLLVLGQTLTTEMRGGKGGGGGSFAAAKVHEGVKGDIVTAAADFVASVVNDQLIPSILRLNYGNADESPVLSLESEKEQDLQADVEIITALAATPFADRIGKDWLGKKFGIPKPAKGEETLQPPAAKIGDGGGAKPSSDLPASSSASSDDTPGDQGGDMAASDAMDRLAEILHEPDDAALQAKLRAFDAELEALAAGEWDESKHPRGAGGKFAPEHNPGSAGKRRASLKEKKAIRAAHREIERVMVQGERYRGKIPVPGVGNVELRYGQKGNLKPDENGVTHKEGYGLIHIADKHGIKALRRLPHVLLRGKRTSWEGSAKEPGVFKRKFNLHGSQAVISRKLGRNTPIVITSFDE